MQKITPFLWFDDQAEKAENLDWRKLSAGGVRLAKRQIRRVVANHSNCPD